MDKIRFVKWGGWLALIGMLLGLFTVISAQPGFLSINCGGKTNYTTENNITWVTDADYIDVGQSGDIGDASKEAFGSALHSLRFFPKPLNKSCYHLSVTPNVTHLLRLWFAVGNFNGYQNFPINFAFSIGTVDMLFLQNVTAKTVDPFYYEYILFTAGRVEYICLVRTSETDDPFISGIELRRLQDDMYVYDSTVSGYILVLESRVDAGGNSSVRYPMDKFDRIWATSSDLPSDLPSDLNVRNVSSRKPLSTNNTQNLPPTDVLQTAWVVKGLNSFPLSWSWSRSRWTETENLVTRIVVLYFAEIETVNKSESISFYVLLDGCEKTNPLVTLVPNYSVLEYTLFCDYAPSNYELVKAPDFPIINAYEYYTQVFTDTTTYQQDIDALDAMKWRFDMKDWISDPCYLIPCNGIGCDNSSGLIRISEIDLSGRNLTGSAPKDIAQLTELVSVSLNDNHFTGPMPNFTNLTMLERLYLQNNNLTGTVEWLSELKSLKELCLQNNRLSGPVEWLSELKSLTKLNIENNNFSGVILKQLLLNCSLKLNYSGNPYLRMNKRKCFLHNLTLSGIKNSQPNNSQRNKLKVVLGITLSGILTITLASIASMVLYRKKFLKK